MNLAERKTKFGGSWKRTVTGLPESIGFGPRGELKNGELVATSIEAGYRELSGGAEGIAVKGNVSLVGKWNSQRGEWDTVLEAKGSNLGCPRRQLNATCTEN